MSTPAPISFQPAGLAHLGVLAGLHAGCFEEVWDEKTFGDLLALPDCFALLALAADEPVGFVLARRTLDEAEILSLGVLPASRCSGVGRRLLAAAMRRLGSSGVGVLFLEVAESNQAARRLYEAAGFRPVGRRERYYRTAAGQEAALVLRRDLPA